VAQSAHAAAGGETLHPPWSFDEIRQCLGESECTILQNDHGRFPYYDASLLSQQGSTGTSRDATAPPHVRRKPPALPITFSGTFAEFQQQMAVAAGRRAAGDVTASTSQWYCQQGYSSSVGASPQSANTSAVDEGALEGGPNPGRILQDEELEVPWAQLDWAWVRALRAASERQASGGGGAAIGAASSGQVSHVIEAPCLVNSGHGASLRNLGGVLGAAVRLRRGLHLAAALRCPAQPLLSAGRRQALGAVAPVPGGRGGAPAFPAGTRAGSPLAAGPSGCLG
jgi:hypothetical protein